VRRYWPLMAAYAGMVVADSIVDAALPAASLNADAGPLVALLAALTGFAKLLLSAVLVVTVVHAHSLVGSDAFWMTRPMSPRMLLASKLLPLAGMVVVFPVLCEIVFMTVYAVPLRTMPLVALQLALLQTSWLVLVMAGAVVTRNLAGFAFLAAGSVVALVIAAAVASILAFRQLDEEFYGGMTAVSVGAIGPAEDSTGAVLSLVLFPVAAIALMAVQYQTRVRWRAIATGVTALAVLWAVVAYWPWPFLQMPIDTADWASQTERGTLSAPPDTVAYQPDVGRLIHDGVRNTPRARLRPVVARVGVDNLDPGWRAEARLISASVDRGDGQAFASGGMRYSQTLDYASTTESMQSASARRLLQVARLAGSYRSPEPETIVLLVPDPPPAPPPAGVYTGAFALELTRLEIEAVLPLRVGESHRRGVDRVVIDEIQTYPALTLAIRRSGATTLFDRHPPTIYEFYVRSRRADEAVAAMAYPTLGPLMLFSGVHFDPMFGFGVTEYSLTLQKQPDGLKINDEWLRDAELVIVRATQRLPVERTLRIENFRIGEWMPR
jgi:hypothetical protein